jgi:hypothetical protein
VSDSAAVLRQLSRLTRPVPAAGPGALAVAVYGDAVDRPVRANESGFEGVACVDDAARLLDVLCDVWTRTQAPWVVRWARGLLEFVLWMQEPDGRWINFVYDWDGARNTSGITSATGENFWHARALVALSHAWLTFGDASVEEALHRGLERAAARTPPPDVRALHVRTAYLLMASGYARSPFVDDVGRWCDELLACRTDGVLMNSPYETGTPHLWAHIHEGVLAESAVLLERPELLEAAVASAEKLIVPVVEVAFDRPGVSPYDVASCVYGLDRLFGATGDTHWAALAADARAWFDGRNTAGTPVYDRERGRVADGIDDGRVSDNSGAEANIVAAEALFDDAVAAIERYGDPFASASG